MRKTTYRSVLAAAMLVVALPQAVAGNSQYIENVPQLTQDPERPGAMTWLKPGVNRAAYTKVMIEPITIFISPDSEYMGVNADQLKAVADGFSEAFTKALEPDIPVVNKKGTGVLYVRAALTNVHLAKKTRGLLGYTPISFLATTDVGPQISLKQATLEIEALDSVSGERVGVLLDKAPKSSGGEELSWDSINKTLVFYAERFKARLEAARKTNGSK